MPRIDTHCSIPPICTFSSRSMPSGVTMLRTSAMILTASARLAGGAGVCADALVAKNKNRIASNGFTLCLL
jgi:hypothetical protein